MTRSVEGAGLRSGPGGAPRPLGARRPVAARARRRVPFSAGSAGPLPAAAATPAPHPTALVVGREGERARLGRALVDVPLALVVGLAGVGKSALALSHAAGWPGPVGAVRLARATSVDEAVEAAGPSFGLGSSGRAEGDVERLARLWSALDRSGGLLLLDDLHAWGEAGLALLLEAAGRAPRRGRVVATSRELLAVAPGAPDRLELRLEGLDRDAARVLWERLDELYGAGPDFEAAWAASRGHPALLRQAHAGAPAPAHPIDDVVRGLDADARRLASALALSEAALPAEVLARLVPPGRADCAVRALVARLVVTTTPDRRYALHELARAALGPRPDDAPARELRSALADALRGPGLDAPTAVREAARQLALLGHHGRVAELLTERGAGLLRQGAAGALRRAIDGLPEGAMTPPLRLARARALAREGHVGRAHDELRRLVAEGLAGPDARLRCAALAAACGELDGAEEALRALLAGPGGDPSWRDEARLGLAWVLALRGRGGEAEALLGELERDAGARAVERARGLRIFLCALEGRDERAAELASEAAGGPAPRGLWPWPSEPIVRADALARVGRTDEAEDALYGRRDRTDAAGTAGDGWALAWARAALDARRGGAPPPAFFADEVRRLEGGRHVLGAVWARVQASGALLRCGRRREALALLEAAAERSRACGAFGLERLVARELREDPLGPDWLAREAGGAGGCAVRARVCAALRDVRAGSAPRPDERLAGVVVPDAPAYAFDRALRELARALAAARREQPRVAAQHLRRAAAEASAGGADADLVAALYDALAAPAASAAALGAPAEALVIDAERHELRAGPRRVCLASRPALRALLYAFAGAPERRLTRDAMARALWGTDYHPVRQESSLKSSVRRLRQLLEGTGAVVRCDDRGYQLGLPADAAFVPPPADSRRAPPSGTLPAGPRGDPMKPTLPRPDPRPHAAPRTPRAGGPAVRATARAAGAPLAARVPPSARAPLAAAAALAALTSAAEARAELRTRVDCFLAAGPVDCQELKSALFASVPYLREAREGEPSDVAVGVRAFELARGFKYVLSFDGGPEGPRVRLVERGVLQTTSPDGALTVLQADLQKGLAPFLEVRAAATTAGGVTTLLLGDPAGAVRAAPAPDSGRWYLGVSASGSATSGTTSSLAASAAGEFNHSADAHRFNLEGAASVNRVRVQFGDGQSQSDAATALGGRALAAANLAERWTVAARATYVHDTRNNLLADARAEAGVAWDLVPVLATNDRSLGARYLIGLEHQRYVEPNVLDRRHAAFVTHALGAYLTWHFADVDLTGDLYASSLVDDYRFASMSSSLSATLRLTERFSVDLTTSAAYRYALINQPRLAPESGLEQLVAGGNYVPFTWSSSLSLRYTFGNFGLSRQDQRWRTLPAEMLPQ